MINALFVCIGNSCRSQMAEGFARKYGSDVMHTWSAGLAPAAIVQPETIEAMQSKNIDITAQFPKSVDELELDAFDVIVNMSGLSLPTEVRGELRVWNVVDPMKEPKAVYIRVRDQIEELVMQFILELRRSQRGKPALHRSPRPPMPAPGPLAPESPALGAALSGSIVKETQAKNNLRQPGQSSQRFGFGRIRRSRD